MRVPGLLKIAVIDISCKAEWIFLHMVYRNIVCADIGKFSRFVSRFNGYSLVNIALGGTHNKSLIAFTYCTVADQYIPYTPSVSGSRFKTEWHIAVV